MKILKAMAHLPFATPDGRLVRVPGYDEKTGIYCDFVAEELKEIPVTPSVSDMVNALMIMWAPWAGYKFATKHDRAAMVAAIMTAVCRPAMAIAPAIFFDAPVQGSGKSKGAGALGALVSGKRGGVTPFIEGAGAEAEMCKKLVSMLLGSESFLLIDNVVGTWRSPVLASLITDGCIKERILGGNSWYHGEARLMICATGNNASLDRDLGRRFIRIRIDTGVATPQARTFTFDPVEKALATRMDIAAAVLTVIQGLKMADPACTARGDAGYSEWNALVRRCVLWLGGTGIAEQAGVGALGDPAYSILEQAAEEDPETIAHTMLITGLHEVFGGVPFQAKDVLMLWEQGERFDTDDPSGRVREGLNALLRQPGNVRPSVISIGKVLRNRLDRPNAGMCFRRAGEDRNGTSNWRVGPAGSAGDAGD